VRRAFDIARSSLALLLVMFWFAFPGLPLMYLVVYPLVWLQPSRRRFHISWYMQFISWGILQAFRLGGARYASAGRIPTGDGGALIVMNHQSLLDICVATRLADPYVPAFVPRALYARGVPLVSPSIRLLDCPIVDPRRDPRGAVEEIRKAAVRERHGLLIFPEGHRSTDGELRPFRSAGIQAILEARRMPVYLVVTDGFWAGRRFGDFLANVPHLRGRTEVLGPFAPPERPEEIESALQGWRERIGAQLRQMRGAEPPRG
jgi:1-acyl-sn-glycerol-3-phosphate acyltransferase